MSKYFASRDECSHHTIFPGVELHTLGGQQMLLSLVEFRPGAVVPRHSHPHEQLGLMIEGELEFFAGDEQRVVRAGDMWRIPGGVEHGVVARNGPAKALDVFHPVREDYL